MPKLTNQSEAWQRGYDWAGAEGEHADLDIYEALDAWGYDLIGRNADDFEKGVKFRQIEQAEDRIYQ